MLSLYIDNLPAVIQSGTSFKLTRENPAFSEQGDYTFEVTLPLAGCPENQRIYRPIHRAEVPLRPCLTDKKFLLVSPLITMKGSARVQSITGEEVKVQLVAGRSEANINTKDADGNDIYIDELDLGTVFDEYDIEEELADVSQHWNSEPYYDGNGKEWTMSEIKTLKNLGEYLFYTANDYNRQHGTYQQTSCTFFPQLNASGVLLNTHCIGMRTKSLFKGREVELKVPLDNYREDYRLDPALMTPFSAHLDVWPDGITDDAIATPSLSPQPRLYECLRRILKALGFTLKENTDNFLRSVIVVHGMCTIRYADMLPHWTLSEFLKEFNNFFSTIVVFGLDGTAEVRFRSSFYSSSNNSIKDVEDTLETEIEDESAENNSSTGNVDYDWPTEDKILRLPDEVWEGVEARHFDNYSELEAYYNALDTYSKSSSNFLLIDDATSNVYASLQPTDTDSWKLTRVDYYPPLLNDTTTRDITTELKIVPARMVNGDGYEGQYSTLPLLKAQGSYTSTAYSVNAAIVEGSSDTNEEKADYIEVAYAVGDRVTAQSSEFTGVWVDDDGRIGTRTYPAQACTIPLAVMVRNDATTGMPLYISFTDKTPNPSPAVGPFVLTDTTHMKVASLNELELITSRIEHQFKFLATAPLDITCTYLIRGRRYVCHKLEYSIHPDYVDPLVTGYFYELNE